MSAINDVQTQSEATTELSAGIGAESAFRDALERIRAETKKPIYETWFKNLSLVGIDDDVIRVGTPNQFVKEWIEGSDLIHTLALALRHTYEQDLTPELVLTDQPEDESEERAVAPPSPPPAPEPAPALGGVGPAGSSSAAGPAAPG